MIDGWLTDDWGMITDRYNDMSLQTRDRNADRKVTDVGGRSLVRAET